MLNKKAIAATAGVEKDGDFKNTTLLLHGDGTNGAQNNTFTDSSTNNFTITRNGNTTQGTFSPFSQTGWSNYFDGSSYIYTADSADYAMGTGDFTVQGWVYSTKTGVDQYLLGQSASNAAALSISISVYKTSTNKIAGFFYSGGTLYRATSAADLPLNQWTHFAFVRDGATCRLYVNGIQDGTVSVSTASVNDSSNQFAIGRLGEYTSNYWYGYVSNISVIKGTCSYPNGTTFTVPTTPLSASATNQKLLTCAANRFLDSNTATTAKTISTGGNPSVQAFSPFAPTATYDAATNGGSGYFDGTGDYLTAASSSAFAMGTGDFCIEGWYYVYSNKNYNIYFDFRNGSGTAVVPYLYSDSTGYIDYYVNGDSRITGNSIIKQNEWTHIAVIRSGLSTKLFVNGAQIGSTYTDNNNYVQGPLYVGRNNGGGTTYDASYFCSGFRVVKGTTGGYGTPGSTITVPSSPKTSDANTSVLLNFTNAGIIDSTAKNVLETVGNAQIDTGTKKFGTGSLEFDGTGDYLTVRSGPWLQFGKDFTLECWIYPTSSASNQMIFSAVDYYRNSLGLQLLTNRTIKFNMCDVESSSGVYDEVTTSSTVSLNDWSHIAVVRYNGTLSVYINGTSGGSTSSTRINYIPTGLTAIASDGGSYLNSSLYTGFIDDLRVTNGVARYTANFTAPTKAFPDQ